MSDSLQPHILQHARLPVLQLPPRVWSNSCPLSLWCHLTISSSVVPFSSCLPIFPSIRVFSNESDLHIRWPKYWSFSFSISPSNEYPGLTSFRIDWFDLRVVKETLKSLLQHRSSKASIFQHSAFFMVQLSHPYVTTGNTIALTIWTFVGKAMCLAWLIFFYSTCCLSRGYLQTWILPENSDLVVLASDCSSRKGAMWCGRTDIRGWGGRAGAGLWLCWWPSVALLGLLQ